MNYLYCLEKRLTHNVLVSSTTNLFSMICHIKKTGLFSLLFVLCRRLLFYCCYTWDCWQKRRSILKQLLQGLQRRIMLALLFCRFPLCHCIYHTFGKKKKNTARALKVCLFQPRMLVLTTSCCCTSKNTLFCICIDSGASKRKKVVGFMVYHTLVPLYLYIKKCTKKIKISKNKKNKNTLNTLCIAWVFQGCTSNIWSIIISLQ